MRRAVGTSRWLAIEQLPVLRGGAEGDGLGVWPGKRPLGCDDQVIW